MKLATLWRRSRRRYRLGEDGEQFSLPTRDEFQPMDTQEQEEMVRSFERKLGHDSRLWRSIFGVFLLCYTGFLFYSAFQQAFYPWELRYHAYFMGEVDSWMTVIADGLAILACLLAVKGLCKSTRPYNEWFWYSCYTGLFLAIFWLYHLLRLPRFHWDALWLPLAPLSGAGLCLYVNYLFMESSEDIVKLRNCMYNYKAR